MTFNITFLVLSIFGAANAFHLALQHAQKKPLVCPLNHDCTVVTQSRYATMLGVRNEYLGVLFFAGLVTAGIFFLTNPSLAAQVALGAWIFYVSLAGFLYSLFLVGLQIFVIKDYCFYCMISAGIATLLFINSFVLW